MKIVERVRGEDGRCESPEVKMVIVSQESEVKMVVVSRERQR